MSEIMDVNKAEIISLLTLNLQAGFFQLNTALLLEEE